MISGKIKRLKSIIFFSEKDKKNIDSPPEFQLDPFLRVKLIF